MASNSATLDIRPKLSEASMDALGRIDEASVLAGLCAALGTDLNESWIEFLKRARESRDR